jgi:hypothetical protein
MKNVYLEVLEVCVLYFFLYWKLWVMAGLYVKWDLHYVIVKKKDIPVTGHGGP